VKKFVPVMLVALYLAACGTPASISGSTAKGATTLVRPDAVQVVDAAKRSTDAAAASHPVAPVSHPTDRLPVTPASRPAAPPPAADSDGATPRLNCEGFSVPGKPQLMCAPQ
jgi:hypothetical protein